MSSTRTIKKELTAERYLPFVRHADKHSIVTTNRAAFQMIKLEGASFRTADTADINSLHDGINHAIRNISDDNLMIYTHVVRSEDPDYPEGHFESDFGSWFDQTYL